MQQSYLLHEGEWECVRNKHGILSLAYSHHIAYAHEDEYEARMYWTDSVTQ